MKQLFAALALAITTLFTVVTTLLECIGLLTKSAKNVAHIVEDASETFRVEEKILNEEKIRKLRETIKEKDLDIEL